MIPFPNKKYQIIYADPPWNYENYGQTEASKLCGRNVKGHYNTMRIDEIYNLPISNITDNNCILFIWGTFPKLPECLETIKRWGFVYKTLAFNWYKRNRNTEKLFLGMGYWTRSNSEYCLLATKGKVKRESMGVFQVVEYPILKHSEKPPIIRDKIVELVGNLPRIELFARQRTEGWDVWGNEVESGGDG